MPVEFIARLLYLHRVIAGGASSARGPKNFAWTGKKVRFLFGISIKFSRGKD